MATLSSRDPALCRRIHRWCVDRPVTVLTVAFGFWKFLLMILVVLSPGPGYDTSATLLDVLAVDKGTPVSSYPVLENTGLRPLLKLVRWDAIYFLSSARRGYVFEQEWAFSYVHGRLIYALSGVFGGQTPQTIQLALAGIVISHVSHYLSVLVLYKLTTVVFAAQNPHRAVTGLGLLTAVFHIGSPASAFLSAPYGEALFSLLNFCGFYSYAAAWSTTSGTARSLRSAVKLVVSGTFFALATLIRSNGVLSGTLFAYDAVIGAYNVVCRRQFNLSHLAHLLVIFIGGIQILLAMAGPQYIAYRLYCASDVSISSRSWCGRTVPSIYTYVQDNYWNVGFLRYWTLPNLPLFLLAIPMIVLLLLSSFSAVTGQFSINREPQPEQPGAKSKLAPKKVEVGNGVTTALLRRLAIPQAVLAVLAFTNYHVQIINRIASGYPVWCWYLAVLLLRTASPPENSPSGSRERRFATVLSCSLIFYALIQGVLFASFLPPA